MADWFNLPGTKVPKSAIKRAGNLFSKTPTPAWPPTLPTPEPLTPGSAIPLDGEYECAVRITSIPAVASFDAVAGPVYSKVKLQRGTAVMLPLQLMHPGFAGPIPLTIGEAGLMYGAYVQVNGLDVPQVLSSFMGGFSPDGATFTLYFSFMGPHVQGQISGHRIVS